jgi:hypothetical protein
VEAGCGIGWHGPVPFVLAAAFPRFGAPLALTPENESAVQHLLLRDGLVRHETRLDHAGLAVIARRQGTADLLLLRAAGGTATAEPYHPAATAGASDEQASWMRYAEAYEHVVMLDAWRDDGTDALLVVSGEATGQIWRHRIDRDGVENWRKPDDESAAGLLYRERLSPGMIAAVDGAGAMPEPAAHAALGFPDSKEPPPDSLLAKAEAYVTAIAALHDAQAAAAGDPSPDEALAHLRALHQALETLSAEYAAAEARRLLREVETHGVGPEQLARALGHIAVRLPDELSAARVMTLAPAQWRHMADTARFGRAVEDAIPEATYDIEEAALCLGFRRPTAAAFHCARVMEAGLAVLGASLGLDLPGEDRRWQRFMPPLRKAVPADRTGLTRALDGVRRCWRSARLAPMEKCTEAEAERLFQAVGTFMAELAEMLGDQPPGR